MKRLSKDEINRLCRIRAMFPEDWCGKQLEADIEASKGMVKITPMMALHILKALKEMYYPDDWCSICESIEAELKPIAAENTHRI